MQLAEKMGKLNTLWTWVRRRKYAITLLAFAVIIVFIDENNLIRRWQLRREAVRLQTEINGYQRVYDDATRQLEALSRDSGAVERIARERYMMKRDNEDIFVFKEDIKQ